MLNRLRSRRWAALAIAAALGHASVPLGAQTPVVGGRTTSPQPRLLADCDISVSSCGVEGGYLYGSGDGSLYGGSGSNVAGTTAPQCGAGFRSQCDTRTVNTCTQWVIVSGDGTVTFSATKAGIGGSITQTCGQWVTNTVIDYYT
jgi:hypothetical protein